MCLVPSTSGGRVDHAVSERYHSYASHSARASLRELAGPRMLSIEHVKQLLDDPSLSDEQIAEVRDVCRALAEFVLDEWRYEELGDA
jgi:hypothetical protein